MPHVELDDSEWQQVLAILSTASWRDANPLIMKIGGQLRAAYNQPNPTQQPTGNGKEAGHE